MIRLIAIGLLSAMGWGRALNGVVRDSNTRPLEGVIVSLTQDLTVRTDTVRTDQAGKYRFPALPAGSYTLRAEKPGYAAATAGPITIQKNEAKQVDLTLSSAAFFDEPSFVVAGVTDMVNRGGHGSETVVRSTETVARAAAELSRASAGRMSPEALRVAIERDPNNAGLHHQLAVAEEKRGNALEAARAYQRAAELDPNENNLFDWGAELLTHRAAEQAAEVFATGHRLFSGSARMLLALGSALYAKGSYEEAAKRFFEATDLNPKDTAPYLYLGKIGAVEIIRMDGYGERMKRFAGLNPETALANYYYAVSLQNYGDVLQVEFLLRKAIRLDPKLADAHLALGTYYAGLHDFSKAIASYRAAIELGTEHEEVHYRLALEYQQSGDREAARKEFALYEELRKSLAVEQEQNRSRIQQFVFRLRNR